ncbi:MbnP family protein [Flavobacterium sp.]|uniref:MbnP family protein n=1 Tax=Flavobacterium sp. TaxID=239 RepID=UPI0026020C14|nr:MbnP family protein [Flavobacterium sp.]
MIRWKLAALFCFLFFLHASAQEKDSLRLQFHLKFDKASIVPNQKYISKQNDTLQLETFRFYVTDIEIHYADNSSIKTKGSHLVDIELPASQKITLGLNQKKEIKFVNFSIGVDSLSNVSGALSGDLDPAKGMYWAWQSGYINMKVEGKSMSCKTRKNQFQFHIGGYLKPNNALRIVTLNAPKNSATIDVDVNAAAFFAEVPLSETNSIMIPGKRAMQLADVAVKMFSLE